MTRISARSVLFLEFSFYFHTAVKSCNCNGLAMRFIFCPFSGQTAAFFRVIHWGFGVARAMLY